MGVPVEGSASGAPTSWQDDLDGNHVGRMHAITVLTPMPWYRAAWLRLQFAKTQLLPGAEVDGLTELAFVHFARWTFWRAPPEARWGRFDRYLLFESNFNGSFAEYLDAFATRLRKNMRRIWSGCYQGPTLRSTTRFREYARRHEAAAACYFCPYPDTTVKEVAAALSLDVEVWPLVRRFEARPPGDGASLWPADLSGELERLLSRLQSVRPATHDPPGFIMWLRALPASVRDRLRALLAPARSGGVSAVTVIAPVAPGRTEALKRDLRRVAEEDCIGIPGRTHFARWVLLENVLHEAVSGDPVALARPRLLFSAAVDGSPDEYLGRLYEAVNASERAVWAHCDGLGDDPEPTQAARFLRAHRVRGGLFFPAYTASVSSVLAALDTRRRLRDFAIWAQGVDDRARGREFLAWFGRPRGPLDATDRWIRVRCGAAR